MPAAKLAGGSAHYFPPLAPSGAELVAAVATSGGDRDETTIYDTYAAAIGHASRADYEELLAGGVRIYEQRYAMLHAKTMVIDTALSMVGSANFDIRSFLQQRSERCHRRQRLRGAHGGVGLKPDLQAEEILEQRGGLFGAFVMDHVTRAAHRCSGDVREHLAQTILRSLSRHPFRQL